MNIQMQVSTEITQDLQDDSLSIGNDRIQQRQLDIWFADFQAQNENILMPYPEEEQNGLGFQNEKIIFYQKRILQFQGLYKQQKNLGNMYLRLGKKKEAAEHFQQAIHLRPEECTHLIKYLFYLKNVSRTQIVKIYERALQVDSHKETLYQQLAQFYLYQQDLKSAIRWYKKLLKITSKQETVYYCLGIILSKINTSISIKQSIDYFRLVLNKGVDIQTFLYELPILFNHLSIREITDYLEGHSKQHFLCNITAILQKMGVNDSQINRFHKNVSNSILYVLGHKIMNQVQFDNQLIKLFILIEDSIDLPSDNTYQSLLDKVNLSMLYIQSFRSKREKKYLTKAMNNIQEAIKMFPRVLNFYTMATQYLLQDMGNEDFEKAITFQLKLIELQKQNFNAHIRIAQYSFKLQKMKACQEFARKAQHINPQSYKPYKYLTLAEVSNGQYDSAIIYYKQMLQKADQFDIKLGELKRAEQQIQLQLRIYPNNLACRQMMSTIHKYALQLNCKSVYLEQQISNISTLSSNPKNKQIQYSTLETCYQLKHQVHKNYLLQTISEISISKIQIHIKFKLPTYAHISSKPFWLAKFSNHFKLIVKLALKKPPALAKYQQPRLKQNDEQFTSVMEKGEKEYSQQYEGNKGKSQIQIFLNLGRRLIFCWIISLCNIITSLEFEGIYQTDLQFRNTIKFGDLFEGIDHDNAFQIKSQCEEDYSAFLSTVQLIKLYFLGFEDDYPATFLIKQRLFQFTSSQRFNQIKKTLLQDQFQSKSHLLQDELQNNMKQGHLQQFKSLLTKIITITKQNYRINGLTEKDISFLQQLNKRQKIGNYPKVIQQINYYYQHEGQNSIPSNLINHQVWLQNTFHSRQLSSEAHMLNIKNTILLSYYYFLVKPTYLLSFSCRKLIHPSLGKQNCLVIYENRGEICSFNQLVNCQNKKYIYSFLINLAHILEQSEQMGVFHLSLNINMFVRCAEKFVLFKPQYCLKINTIGLNNSKIQSELIGCSLSFLQKLLQEDTDFFIKNKIQSINLSNSNALYELLSKRHRFIFKEIAFDLLTAVKQSLNFPIEQQQLKQVEKEIQQMEHYQPFASTLQKMAKQDGANSYISRIIL